ncbi:MAG: class I SAM-dependent methyltransferase, partial [Rubricoccaceae bacterium]|nr:class I SAM-dependent methyltransferase [Rubricoccaceae bacterium]
MESVLAEAHRLLAAAIKPGDVVVDATTGNGHDTLHLAKCVGPTGLVIGFDVQQKALESTRLRLEEAGCLNQTVLLHAGHETMSDAIPEALERKGRGANEQIAAACFNLGYLPGSDKSLITKPATTRVALRAALKLLRPGGVVTIVAYPGHVGGEKERDAIRKWATELSEEQFEVQYRVSPDR